MNGCAPSGVCRSAGQPPASAYASLHSVLTDTAETARILLSAYRMRLSAQAQSPAEQNARWRLRSRASMRAAQMLLRNTEASVRKLERVMRTVRSGE